MDVNLFQLFQMVTFDVFYVQVLCVPYFIILLRIIEGSKAIRCSTCIIVNFTCILNG